MTERDKAIESLLTIVRDLARRVTRRFNNRASSDRFAELDSDGCLGAIRTMDDYDPSKGTREGYAVAVIRGAIRQ